MKKVILILSSLATTLCALALQMPAIFSDKMVLQRDVPINVWGKASPNAKIKVEFGKDSANTTADANGDWLTQLPSSKANANPQTLKVSENGITALNFSDVLVGEVWLTSGQSNMQFNVGGLEKKEVEQIKKRADYPLIREIKMAGYVGMPEPQFDIPQKSISWRESNAKNVTSFSAVAWLFAERLHKDLGGVPVGLINTAVGGSSMICWIPKEKVKEYSGWEKRAAEFEKLRAQYDYQKAMKNWKEKLLPEWEKANAEWKKNKQGKKPKRPYEPTFNTPLRYYTSPYYIYNAKIAPITKFNIRGTLWYQGENDSAKDFDIKLSKMIEAWRETFNYLQMPFLVVQMPSYNANWFSKCQDQFKVFKTLKNVGLANAIDTGEEKDIHPKDKTPIARRLEMIALHDVYKITDAQYPYGPMFKDANFKDNQVEIEFETGGRKLKADGDATGFEVRTKKGKWQKPSDVKIITETKILVSATDGELEQVRYLYGKFPKPFVWLKNTDGEPAYCFEAKK